MPPGAIENVRQEHKVAVERRSDATMRPHKDHQLISGTPGSGTSTVQWEVIAEYLLTIDEAAQRLRVSGWSVYNMIRANQLRAVKTGRRRLLSPSALTECVNQLDGKVA